MESFIKSTRQEMISVESCFARSVVHREALRCCRSDDAKEEDDMWEEEEEDGMGQLFKDGIMGF